MLLNIKTRVTNCNEVPADQVVEGVRKMTRNNMSCRIQNQWTLNCLKHWERIVKFVVLVAISLFKWLDLCVVFAWNIIALRDTVCVVWRLFLSNEDALVAQINDLHFWKKTYIYKDLTELHYAQYLCTRCPCWDQTPKVSMLRVQNCKCPARAVTAAGNAYTKRDIENSFPGTQMFVQAKNYECPQQQCEFKGKWFTSWVGVLLFLGKWLYLKLTVTTRNSVC